MTDSPTSHTILFVRGFNTWIKEGELHDNGDSHGHEFKDLYWTIKLYLEAKFPNCEFYYFNYKCDDELADVISELNKKIKEVKPTYLIGHSYGGMLVADWCRTALVAPASAISSTSNVQATHSNLEKVILLMPFLPSHDITLSIVKTIRDAFPFLMDPILKHIVLPGPIVFNLSAMFDILSYMRLDWSLVPFYQPLEGYNKVIDEMLIDFSTNPTDECIQLLDKLIPTLHTIIGDNDAITSSITTDSLRHIFKDVNIGVKDINEISGTHVEFRSSRINAEFFDEFKKFFE
jgi:pimeloyl-ACP methyl ester carboxylesterase